MNRLEKLIAFYGGREAYAAEMSRRRSKVKNYYLKDHPEAAQTMLAKKYKKHVQDKNRSGRSAV